MRILHTSDWHLGARLGTEGRTKDQFERLQELCGYIDNEEVDVLLVAGDVFEEHPDEPLAKIITRLARLLRPRIEEGLSCVFIAGNHDKKDVFAFLRGLQDLVSPKSQRRVIFAEQPGIEQVSGRNGELLNLLLLPYPTLPRYNLANEQWPSLESKNQALAGAVRASLQELTAQVRESGRGVPVVLCGHFLVRGVTEGLYKLTEQDDIPLEAGDFPAYAYIALGHIHKPQSIGAPHIRYCGSLDRMDRAEADYEKQVLLVDVTRSGLQDIRPLPLRATPFVHVQATSESELEAAVAALAEPERTLISLTLTLHSGQSRGALQARARQLFPRLYQVQWAGTQTSTVRSFAPPTNLSDVTGTVRAYLRQKLDNDPDAEALMQEAEGLLATLDTGAS